MTSNQYAGDRMDYHKNAPWTAVSRGRLARLVIEDGVRLVSAAARFSVSSKTAAKWVARYRQLGDAGLVDRSSRPHLSPRQTSSLLVSPEAENGLTEMKRQAATLYLTENCCTSRKSSALESLPQNHTPAQRFLNEFHWPPASGREVSIRLYYRLYGNNPLMSSLLLCPTEPGIPT